MKGKMNADIYHASARGVSVIERVCLPFFLFSAVLAFVTLLLRFVVLPPLLKVEVGGTPRDVSMMRVVRRQLEQDIRNLEERRQEILLPLRDQTFDVLKSREKLSRSFLMLRDTLEKQAQAVSRQPDAVHISMFEYVPQEKQLVVSGDVRFVGPRSMTVLAQFIDSIEALPFVSSVTKPAFDRMEDPTTGFHSPFSVRITLSS